MFLDTPQYECAALGDVLGCSITLKIETLNPVRSFKGRGTETALSWLAQREEAPTAVCASAGNLGQALAYSGARRGIPVTVVAARTANPFKIERITSPVPADQCGKRTTATRVIDLTRGSVSPWPRSARGTGRETDR